MPRGNPPKDHPAPYKSSLWKHEEFIRELRRKRLSWAEISGRLQSDHGLTIGSKTVYNFFRRMTRPKRKNAPIGFETSPLAPQSSVALATQPKPEDDPEAWIEQAREASRNRQPSFIKITPKPGEPL